MPRRVSVPANHLLVLQPGRRHPRCVFDHSRRAVTIETDPPRSIPYVDAATFPDFIGRFRRGTNIGNPTRRDHPGVVPPFPAPSDLALWWRRVRGRARCRVWLVAFGSRHLVFAGDARTAEAIIDGLHRRGLPDASRTQ